MKKLRSIITLICLIFLSGVAFSADLSLPDTIDYIKGKLENYGDAQSAKFLVHCRVVSFSGGVLVVSISEDKLETNYRSDSTVKITLSRCNPDTITVITHNPTYYIVTVKGSKHAFVESDNSEDEVGCLYFSDKDEAEHVAKAFKHAVELARSQKDPFD